MSKKSSRRKFIFLSVLVAIGIFLTIFQWNIPFTDKVFNGFANSIKLGLDLKGGISAVYEAKLPEGSTGNLDTAIDGTITRLQDLITDKGYPEATLTKQGASRIRIEVPDISDPDEIFDLIGEPAKLQIKKENSVDAEAIITGDDITNAYASAQQGEAGIQYGVVLNFTYSAGNTFSELTKEVSSNGGNIYIFLGDDKEPFSTLSVQEQITGGSTFISGGSIDSYESAEEYALKIVSGTFSVELELLENNVVSATLGADALKYGIIAGVVALVLIMILMYVVYGDFGLLADFSLIIYLVLEMFFLQAIPLVQLTLPGIAGIILSLGMAVDANVIIFERIKDEYRNGKKIPYAAKAGFKKAFTPILDSNITTIIASLVLYILGSGAIKGFAITLLIGIVLSMFTSLVVTRYLVKLYLPLNSTKAKKLRLKKEEVVNEK